MYAQHGRELMGDLPSPKATARQEVPCTRTYGVDANGYYQKYEPKARAGGLHRNPKDATEVKVWEGDIVLNTT